MCWANIPSPAFQHIFYAAFLALFLQWGTTGAALFVGYYTPPVGLGCRSGSYLIYGVAATVSWLFLVFSQVLSHAVMQRFERDPLQRSPGKTRLAVATRVVGKVIATANAGWLIALSVIAEIGIFKTCLCQSDSFQYHAGAWIGLFRGVEGLGLWLGGFMVSIVVGILTSRFREWRVQDPASDVGIVTAIERISQKVEIRLSPIEHPKIHHMFTKFQRRASIARRSSDSKH
ncbi:hypothetical protein K438DRAFT_1872339, partial [Mycena galopus ATCC 62051]